MVSESMSAWVVPSPDEVDGPGVGPHRPMLEAYVNYQRRTFWNICAGLTAEQLAMRPIPSTNLTLLGLMRHLSKVERIWFRIRIAEEDVAPLFDADLGKDYDFEHIDPAQAREAFEIYRDEVRRAQQIGPLADWDKTVEWRGGTWSVGMIHIHMVGEYARHNGHADLLRQAIDGVTNR